MGKFRQLIKNEKIVVILFLYFFLQASLYAYSTNPENFVNELVTDVIKRLSDKSLNQEEKEKFVELIAVENVDINALGLYTLGELRKSSSDQDIDNYQKAFKKYFLKSLTSRLSDYSSSEFEVLNSDQKSSNYTIVSSQVEPENGGPKIKIDWRIYTKIQKNL